MVSPIDGWIGHNRYSDHRPPHGLVLQNTTFRDDTVMEANDYDGSSSAHRAHRRHPVTLSAHELATLFRLRNASVLTDVETPDVIALQEAGMVQVIVSEDGDAALALTVDGKVLLRMLGAEPVGSRSDPN
ncbi:hypothetical protein J8I87_36460 [Paraburkholderia sp. LEh10]|uniref:hypothetical protein n=1 Tax=Paraburkholderia sp. LEh10 TaxID=2821353 RepID=UPI001AE2ADE0|nr:hypothetical protein [Paraburkholderia sp. LEh10]MBP0595056.1 hypothetical protein [Paraburkholderia sp. LEh10]